MFCLIKSKIRFHFNIIQNSMIIKQRFWNRNMNNLCSLLFL